MSKEKKGTLPQVEQAKKMVGKKYILHGQQVEFESFKVNGEFAFMTIGGDEITTTVFDLPQRLHDLKPLRNNLPDTTSRNEVIPLESVDDHVIKTLRDSLLESIQRVSSDPTHVKQAREVSNSVQTMINLAKTELEIKKAIREDFI